MIVKENLIVILFHWQFATHAQNYVCCDFSNSFSWILFLWVCSSHSAHFLGTFWHPFLWRESSKGYVLLWMELFVHPQSCPSRGTAKQFFQSMWRGALILKIWNLSQQTKITEGTTFLDLLCLSEFVYHQTVRFFNGSVCWNVHK